MTQLVDDLLTLARLDEQRKIDPKPIDLLGLASDLVIDTRATAQDRQITLIGLTPDASPQPAPTLGDSNRLRQVISNLMTNALRYTPAGTDIAVAVGTAPSSDGQLSASVVQLCDRGPRISPAAA